MKLKENLMLTDWFPPDVKPVRAGFYQVNTGGISYSYFDGEVFSFFHDSIENVKRSYLPINKAGNVYHESLSWRGLAKKP